jgi:acyl-CoA thioesterase
MVPLTERHHFAFRVATKRRTPIRSRTALSFDDDIALQHAGAHVYEGEVCRDWWTPRGPLGGYVMALMVRALELTVDDPARQPRSCTMHFLRPPQAGPITASAVVERAGRTLTSVSGRLDQDGKLMGLALGAFSTPWESPLLDETQMPVVEPARGRTSERKGLPDAGPAPFVGRMVFQHRFGAELFSGADRAEVGGWLGLREERPLDAAAVCVLADAWFPAPWPRLRALAGAPTIELTIHFRAPLPIDDTLLLGRFRTRLVRDGFFEEDGELWAPDGTLVAQSRQLALLVGAQV